MDAPSKDGVMPQSKDVATASTRRSRAGQISVALIGMFIVSVIAYGQVTSTYRWHEPYQPSQLAFWLRPIEWNIDAALPEIVGTINAVEVLGNRIIVAGNAGLLASSVDRGQTWTLLTYVPQAHEFRTPDAQAPATPPSTQAFLERFVPTLHAQAAPRDRGVGGAAQQSAAQQAQPPASPDDISPSANPVTFPAQKIGATATIPVQFTNRTSRPLLVAAPGVGGDDASSFSVKARGCDFPLGQFLPGQICSLDVTFTPRRTGRHQATLSLGGRAIALYGDGLAETADTKLTSPKGGGIDAAAAAPPAKTDEAAPPRTGKSTTPDTPTASTAAPDLAAFGYCVVRNCELFERGDQNVLLSTDGGLAWKPVKGGEGTSTHGDVVAELKQPAGSLRDAQRDGANRFWVVRSNGGLFRLESGQWIPVTRTAAASLPGHAAIGASTRYSRSIPPWYPGVFIAFGLLLIRDRRRTIGDEQNADLGPLQVKEVVRSDPKPNAPLDRDPDPSLHGETAESVARQDSAIGNQGTADKPLSPGEPDALGLGIIANGLAFFLRNERTKPPLVLAINGRWGSGKSSLMNLLKSRLEEYGARPVWFNAWHHQQEDQLLAALLKAVQAQAIPPLSSAAGWTFRSRLAWKRLQRSWVQLALILGALGLMWQVELHLRESGYSIGKGVSALLTWTQQGSTTAAAAQDKANAEAAQALKEASRITDGARATALNEKADRLLEAASRPSTQTPFGGIVQLLQDSTLIALITTLAAGFKTISGGLRAFASQPASLLAAESGSTTAKDLEAQTSFRQRFAEEFADVTGAFGVNQRMMILIDDLDRCQPEKVREVLEAVNFLCASGECFIVLGMARSIVEHCVGLSFREVVDTMAWEAFELSDDEIESFREKARTSTTSTMWSRLIEQDAKRLAFARLFLDKLIQIEVSIPEPTPLQKKTLFETDEERKAKRAADIKVTKWLGVADTISGLTAPVLKALCVLVVVFGLGSQLGRAVSPAVDRLIPQQPKPATVANGPAPPTTPLNVTPPPQGGQASQPAPQIIAGVSGTSSGWLGAWPFYAAVLVAFTAVSIAARRLPHQSVVDAKPFTNALAIWHPLVMTTGARNTPRTARRFQNRVRYLAMRQRALILGAPVPRLEDWLRALVNAPPVQPEALLVLPDDSEVLAECDRDLGQIGEWLTRGSEGSCDLASVKQTAEGPQIEVHETSISPESIRALAMGQVRIPEPILVALAAIDEFMPKWIDDPDQFSEVIAKTSKGAPLQGAREEALAEAVGRHTKSGATWTNLIHFRRAYLRLCSEIDHTQPPQTKPPSRPVVLMS